MRNLVQNCAVLVSLCVCSLLASATEFTSGWDNGWRHVHQHGHPYGNCWLSLQVPGYGEARFVRRTIPGGGGIGFEFQSDLDLHKVRVELIKSAPEWHPEYPAVTNLGAAIHIQGGGVLLLDARARGLFIALRDGYEAQLRDVQDSAGTPLVIDLKSINAASAMQKFLACLDPAVEVSWAVLSRSRISYPVDASQLDADARAQLDRVIRYLAADESVTQVFIDGHTDASGTERGNSLLAKRRAEVVAAYLRTNRVTQALTVRYHGAKYPVADNDTPAGKARNRRTTLRLARSDPDESGA